MGSFFVLLALLAASSFLSIDEKQLKNQKLVVETFLLRSFFSQLALI